MVHFELREVVGSQKLMKVLDKKCPEIVPKISRSEATHIVEQVFRVLREYRLEYVIALDMLDQFEHGYSDTIQVHATKRKEGSNVYDGVGILYFSLNYGESPAEGHRTLRAWARAEFSRIMIGVRET